MADLVDRVYDAELLVPEDDDISLAERVRRVNAACFLLGKQNVILISVHVNAAGDGTRWHTATGWSCYTTKGHTLSDTLATCLYQSARRTLKGQVVRTDYAHDGDPDWEENFFVLRKSHCIAVLSENFFMDNKSDLEYLQSRAGKQAVVDTHVEGIVEYISLKPSFL